MLGLGVAHADISKGLWHWCFLIAVPGSSSKSTSHERKSALTPTQRESVPAKSPVPAVDSVVSHSPFDPHHRSTTAGEVYRSHLPTHLDPAMPFHRALDPGKCSVYWQLIAKKYFMTVEAIIVQCTVQVSAVFRIEYPMLPALQSSKILTKLKELKLIRAWNALFFIAFGKSNWKGRLIWWIKYANYNIVFWLKVSTFL